MSTRVNISVKDQALIDRAKDLQNASRARLITKNQEKKNEEKAAQKIDKALGSNATTASLGGVRTSSYSDPRPARERTPAATGRKVERIFFGPKYLPYYSLTYSDEYITEYAVYFLVDTIKQKGGQDTDQQLLPKRWYLAAVDYEFTSPFDPPEFITPSIENDAAPGGGNALKVVVTNNSGTIINRSRPIPASGPLDYYLNSSKITIEWYSKISLSGNYTDVEFDFACFFLRINDYNDSEVRIRSIYGGSLGPSNYINVSLVSFSNWTHFAVTFENGTYKFYIAGNLIDSYEAPDSETESILELPQIGFFTGSSVFGPLGTDTLWLNGLRFLSKIEYKGNFTPPTSIK